MHDGRFPVELVGGVPVVAAPEEIDITNAPELRSALLEAATEEHVTLVADLTRTRFCDSSGVHACWRRISAPRPTAANSCWSFPMPRCSASSRSPALTA